MPKIIPREYVALVCTGSTNPKREVPEVAKKFLENQYKINAVYKKDTYSYLPAQERANIFCEYLLDEKIKLIWALRGGEGSADLIPFIHSYQNKIRKISPKILLGFSDFTPLLIYFAQEYNWPVIHGAGLARFFDNSLTQKTQNLTEKLLFKNLNEIIISDLKPLNQLANIPQKISAKIIGGNLSLINISVKESWELDTHGKILLLEDVNEKAHAVHRTLKHLQRIGLFKEAQAILFGDFNGNPIGSTPQLQKQNANSLMKTLRIFAQDCQCPVLYTRQVGHGKINYPVIFNYPVILTTGKNSVLQINLSSQESVKKKKAG